MLTWHNFCIDWLVLKHISSKTKLRVILLKYYIIFHHMSPKLRGPHPPANRGVQWIFWYHQWGCFYPHRWPQKYNWNLQTPIFQLIIHPAWSLKKKKKKKLPLKYFNWLNMFKKVIESVFKHFFASFCLKYLVPTISVIFVTDLWSVIRIVKKGSIETLLRSFNTCQARQLLHGPVTWFCTKFEYNTTKSGFWGKVSFIQPSPNALELV